MAGENPAGRQYTEMNESTGNRNLASQIAVETEQLTRHFGATRALNSIDLQVSAGEVFGLLGHNGAGKTTTIRLLNGLIPPTSGSATVLGMCPTTHGPLIRARTGVLTESPALDRRLTGRENLEFFADLFGVEPRKAKRRIDFLIDAFDLNERDHELVETYSKGMHQRLALARAMLHEPEILFLDEPTSGLDPVASRVVHLMINAFRSDGGAVFLCTHDLEEAERLCDRVAIIEHGQVIATGRPDDLTSRAADQQIEIEIDRDCGPRALQAAKFVVPDATVVVIGKVLRIDGIRKSMVPLVLEALTEASIPVYRVTPRVVTLEDVYFALHREDGRL